MIASRSEGSLTTNGHSPGDYPEVATDDMSFIYTNKMALTIDPDHCPGEWESSA